MSSIENPNFSEIENITEDHEIEKSDEYTPEVKKFLENHPEIKESLQNKYYYHITHKRFKESILKLGIKKDAMIIEDSDIKFLKDLFGKYGNKNNQDFFNYHILGKDEEKDRPIWISSSPVKGLYEIPERLKFILQNLNYLQKSDKLTTDEKIKCKYMLNKYLSFFEDEKDGTVILKINLTCPAILNEVLGHYNLERTNLNIITHVLESNDPNISINQNIPAKYISVYQTEDFSNKKLHESINREFGVVFN